jgi:hypothetical protein
MRHLLRQQSVLVWRYDYSTKEVRTDSAGLLRSVSLYSAISRCAAMVPRLIGFFNTQYDYT